jgi:hypothetical protein
MKKAVGLRYYNVGRSPMFALQQMLLSPVVGVIKSSEISFFIRNPIIF